MVKKIFHKNIATKVSTTCLALFLFVFLMISVAVSPIWAVMVVNDHFDDGTLDPAWSVNFQSASGWSSSESGTNLTVTDITPISTGSWSKVILSQTFTPLTDFKVDFDFFWDSDGDIQAIQKLEISLLDSGNNSISYAGYSDNWVQNRGS